jgi:hypothetical protein
VGTGAFCDGTKRFCHDHLSLIGPGSTIVTSHRPRARLGC